MENDKRVPISDIIEGATEDILKPDQHSFFWGKGKDETSMLAHMCAIRNGFCITVRDIAREADPIRLCVHYVDCKSADNGISDCEGCGRYEQGETLFYADSEIDCRTCEIGKDRVILRLGMSMPTGDKE